MAGRPTWLDDHQGRPYAPLNRCVKPSKCGALTNTLELEVLLVLLVLLVIFKGIYILRRLVHEKPLSAINRALPAAWDVHFI